MFALLPRDQAEVAEARVWLAWCEAGRSNPEVEQQVARARSDERELLDHVLDGRLSATALTGVLTLVQGLRDAICATEEPMSLELARDLLTRYVDQALDSAPDVA